MVGASLETQPAIGDRRSSRWAIALASFLARVGISVQLTLWFTVFQQQVPEVTWLAILALPSVWAIRPAPRTQAPATA